MNAWYLPNPLWKQIDRALNGQGVEMEQATEMTELVRGIFKERIRLIPYLAEQFKRYEVEGIPVFRALVMDYPEDTETWTIDDAYLVGDCYLFAPLTAESDERRVYLPGSRWKRNGETFDPGWHIFRAELHEYILFEKE